MDLSTRSCRLLWPGLAVAAGLLYADRVLRPADGQGGHCAGYLATAAIWLLVAAVACGPGGLAGSHPLPAAATATRRAAAVAPSAAIGTRWPVRRAAADHRLLHRRPDGGHVLHGHAGGLLHPRLLVRLHARRIARDDRPAGPALPTASRCARRGRFHRFFQYLSLFCFSMLGLVIAGNVAMVFVFWELVGICSYL